MSTVEFDVVTGAFGFSGKYITRRLLDMGHTVRTLTNSFSRPHPFGNQVQTFPYHFDDPAKLTDTLRGAAVLYNTYWVRFDYSTFSQAKTIENSVTLFTAAKRGGVKRVVHISITNPSEASSLPYFSGKARLERALIESGLSYAILRPAVLFGKEDILINNIAWTLRHLPVFGVFGDGNYRLQPIYVDDLAKLAVEQGQAGSSQVIDAIGPETFTYRELVHSIGKMIGKNRPIFSVPPILGYWAGWLIGQLVGDVMLTRDEIAGLMQDLLCTSAPPVGTTCLTEWVKEYASSLGLHYASELKRRLHRDSSYENL
ncbi:MAG: NAD-dependent epimerase/dehydratase family protein [Anaerolineales bacterium]